MTPRPAHLLRPAWGAGIAASTQEALERSFFFNQPKNRVRARGLQETMRFRHPCRPGPLTGRFSKHALRKYAKRVRNQDRLTACSESSSRREEALHRFCFRGHLSLVTSAATGSGVFKQALKHARVVFRRRCTALLPLSV